MDIQKKSLQLNWLLWVLISLVFACSSEQNLRDVVDDQSLPEHPSFNFDIRPILSNNCYLCHGPDISTREANLRLDLEEGLTAELGDGRQVIVPGNPGQSELMWRVRNHNPDLVMPPPETKRMLSDREIALLDRWIEQGAKWEPYWAFKKPAKPDIPSGYDHPIDALVTEKLEDLGLEPAPIADANALVRRLSYVLTGLPPSAHQLGHGPLGDGASYEELVDKFMASPHFGERWARHWMDLTRYAEGKGHEFDYPVLGAWQYRDYLIRAFNADLPYDQIVKEHLAGDLIEPPRLHPTEGFNESLIATMHYRMSEGKHSPVDIKEEESDRIDNIIDVTTKTFQALTVSCAQCHDHKFDPIPTADYYSLYGIFESTRQAVHQRESLEEVNQTRQAIEDQIAYLKSAVSTELRSLSSMPQAQQISHRPSQESPEAKALGHFANGETNGWTTQGLVRNILGEVVEQDG
ncbi:MAG: DUF1549 domain-containing protein, partial [Saprospiraceae bacterium]|nr:DUF1549 domain-containing protein [Saprospiraceae bacterium]